MIDTSTIPAYVKEETERVENELIPLLAKNQMLIGFNTDQHLYAIGSPHYLPAIYGLHALGEIADFIGLDLICLGGDGCGYSEEDKDRTHIFRDICEINYAVRNHSTPVISMAGNHDAGQNNRAITGYEVFNAHMKRSLYNTNAVFANNHSTNCYMDFDNHRIRVIFLDTNTRKENPVYTADDRRAYLVNTLNDTLANKKDYSVIVFSHQPINNTLSPDWFQQPIALQDCLTDFVSRGGHLICSIVGHSHNDAWEVNDDILYIATAQAASHQSNKSMDNISNERTRGTRTETAFDIFAIDQEEKTITAIRYGCGENRKWSYGENKGKIAFH